VSERDGHPVPTPAPPPVSPAGCVTGCWACCHDRTGTGKWAELDPQRDQVPDGLTWEDGDGRRYMRIRADGSCIALAGGLCSIYQERPQVCRDFEAGSWQCDSARARRENP
jgi:Fe-S-cluster containining protein